MGDFLNNSAVLVMNDIYNRNRCNRKANGCRWQNRLVRDGRARFCVLKKSATTDPTAARTRPNGTLLDPKLALLYFPSTSTTNVSGRIAGRGWGWSVVGAGGDPNCAVTVYTWCVLPSRVIVRAPL